MNKYDPTCKNEIKRQSPKTSPMSHLTIDFDSQVSFIPPTAMIPLAALWTRNTPQPSPDVDPDMHDDNAVIFLDTLLARVRRLELVPSDQIELVDGDIPDLDVDELTARKARDLALRIYLVNFRQEGWHWLFDHLTGIPFPQVDNQWALDGIHTVHQLEQTCSELGAVIESWMELNKVQEGFKRLALASKTIVNKKYAMTEPGMTVIDYWPTSCVTVGYQVAATCVDCWKFLRRANPCVRDVKPYYPPHENGEWISLEGYDPTGKNWLSIAIEHDNIPFIEYVIETLTAEEINEIRILEVITRLVESPDDPMNGEEKLHPISHRNPVAQLIEGRNTRGLELLLAKYQKAGLRLDWLNTDKWKILLCTFANPTLATSLLLSQNIDITCIEDKSTTPWHEAVRENPYGIAFLEWLRLRSGDDLNTVRNIKNHTALEHAIRLGKITPIKWLFNNMDFEKLPSSDATRVLQMAAVSTARLSVEIFQTVLHSLPRRQTKNLAVAKSVCFLICDAYRGHPGVQQKLNLNRDSVAYIQWNAAAYALLSVDDAKNMAIRKCQILVNHLPSTWPGSNEQKSACRNVTLRGCDFLASYMVTPTRMTRSKARSSPGRRAWENVR